jgi:hypothetical protein
MKKLLKLATIRYSHCYLDEPASEELVRQILRHYSRDSVLNALSVLSFHRATANLMADSSAAVSEQIVRGLVRACYGVPRIMRTIGDEGNVIFTRPNLLFIAREALTACPEMGTDIRTEPHRFELGRLLLAAFEILRPAEPPSGDQLPSMVAGNMFVGTGIKNRVVQSNLMTDSLFRAVSRGSPNNPYDAFRRGTGLTLETYRKLCVSIYSAYVDAEFASALGFEKNIDIYSSAVAIDTSSLTSLGIEQRDADKFLAINSHEIREMPEGDVSSNNYNFITFRAKPFVKTAGGRYLLVDPGFLLDKLHTGPLFELVRVSEPKERNAIFSLWGKPVFEDYVEWVLSNNLNQEMQSLVVSPRFLVNNENEEICDFALHSNDGVVLIECKGCQLKGDALESLDPNKLNSEIERKLRGTESTNQGATQLANSINRLYSAKSPPETRHGALKAAKIVYPVLMVRDEIGDAPQINSILNDAFEHKLKRELLITNVQPLICLSSGTLNGISAFLGKRTLASLLRLRRELAPILGLQLVQYFPCACKAMGSHQM